MTLFVVVAAESATPSETARAPLPTVQVLLLLPALLLPTEVVRAEDLQVDLLVCPDFLPLMLLLVQTLSLAAQVLLLLSEKLLGTPLGLRLPDLAV